ncbi:hypothetical protein [Nocardia harenae]|uniref:hypothetical protein n=1 Tax=Nocardia harenae TaxID=358707 RepID=UPI0008319C1B|nr:hypothetical protein [Nocardia harenae]
MPVTVRVGAVHLGWDVVSVAAGGGETPIRPVKVEGSYSTPAYLLADSSGRLHTAGVDRLRPDLGMAIADVRDILGHPQIVVAGATWPAAMVFRARLYNPLASIGSYLRGKPDVVAMPYPDDWPEEKVELYAELVEQLDVEVEPLPESVALSGYVRALNLVSPPDEHDPNGVGATGVYCDGRTVLVVAVHGDDEQPTESVDVHFDPAALREARAADDVVIEVMAAARSIGADTSTILLAGNVYDNEPLRFAFRNHLGQRFRVADHPIHALVLGAAHLLVSEDGSGEPEQGGRHAERGEQPAAEQPEAAAWSSAVQRDEPEPPAGSAKGGLWNRMRDNFFGAPAVAGAMALAVVALPGDGHGTAAEPAAPAIAAPAAAGGAVGSGAGFAAADGVIAPGTGFVAAGGGAAPVVPGAAPVAGVLSPAGFGAAVSCAVTPRIADGHRDGIASVRAELWFRPGRDAPARDPEPDCTAPGVDTLRYLIPGPPGARDPGPPIAI